jgi:hypothetical protein
LNFDFLPPILEKQSQDAVSLQNRIMARQALTHARIPTPKGRQVDSLREVEAFVQSHGYPIGVRTASRTTRLLNSGDYDRFISRHPVYPLWIEKWYPSICSPNAQILVSHGHRFNLFVSRQKLNGIEYAGNTIGDLPTFVSERCLELTNKFVESLRDYHGIIGIDFIVTPDQDILAVDVNARFNSSTLPFWWFLTSEQCHTANVGLFLQHREILPNMDKTIPARTATDQTRSLIFSPIFGAPNRTLVGYHKLIWR